MPEASAEDVRLEIDTHLDDAAIEGASDDADDDGLIGRVAREIDRAYDSTDITFEDPQHRQDFEAVLTALRIAEGRDRRAEQAQSGRTSTTYETAEIDNLRKRVRRLDPGEEFGRSGRVVRDDGRHVTSSGGNS
jgi:hypothetical protein